MDGERNIKRLILAPRRQLENKKHFSKKEIPLREVTFSVKTPVVRQSENKQISRANLSVIAESFASNVFKEAKEIDDEGVEDNMEKILHLKKGEADFSDIKIRTLDSEEEERAESPDLDRHHMTVSGL